MRAPRLLLFCCAAAAWAQPTGIITTIAGAGVRGYNGDGIPAIRADLFLTPLGIIPADLEVFTHIAVAGDGSVYIPDKVNNRVRRVLPDGSIVTIAGNGVHGFDTADRATEAALDWPASVAFDSSGNLYIADQHNNRIRRVSPDGLITTFAGNGGRSFSGNGGRALAASFDYPAGLAFDAQGNLYVSDQQNNQVRRVTPAGIITAYAGGGPEAHGFSGDDGPGRAAALDFPAGLAFDASGTLYIADQHNNRIRRVAPDGIITTFAGDGEPRHAGDGGPARLASLHYPSDAAFDAAGNLYIADQRNHRIRRVDRNGIITTVAGSGAEGFAGDGGPPLRAALNRPGGVAFDRDGNLYIADQYNDRIRKVVFNPPALAVSAAALSFAATAGGANPAAQTLLLANSGAGALRYTASDDQAWLTVTPASGSVTAGAPAALTVSVSIANLAAGEYSGAITIGSGEAINSPQTVRVTLVVRPLAAPAPTFAAEGVVHAASFNRGPVAPGQIVSIFGSSLGPAGEAGPALDPATGRLQTARAGVTVLFNDIAGPILYAQERQINVQVPYELAGQASARVVARYLDLSSAPVAIPVTASAPGIFAVAPGRGQAALLNEDFSVNSAANPAARGSIVQIFLTGQGATLPAAITGELPRPPLPVPVLQVTVTIGGQNADMRFAGLAPGLAGLLQVNAVVPADITPADNVPLQVTIGSAATQPGVTLAVRE